MASRGVSRQSKQSGFTLLELMVVLAVVAMLISQGADWYMQYSDQQVAKVVSTQHQQVDKAAAAYIKKNYTTLMSGTLPVTKDIDVLRTEGFMPDYSFDCSTTPCKLKNAYSQEYKLVIRKAGTAPNQRLEALVLTFGGQTLGKGDMIRVARNLGASGGYVEAGGAVGSMQGWAIPNLASAFGAGANVGDGHLASAIYFVDGTQSSDYLYRNAVPGKPELNRMGTALDMGGNSITAADQVKAKRGEFSRDGAAPCCGDTGTISLSENTSVTGKSASISLHNGGVSEGGIELAKSGQRRIRFFDNQGVTMGIEATGGITSNTGNVTASNGWIVAYGGGLLSNVWQSHSGGRWTDTGAQFEVNRSIYSAGNVAAAGAMTANTMTANAVTSNGRLTTGEFVDVRGVANEGWGCSPNGLIGRDAAGALLSCQSGMWKGVEKSLVLTGFATTNCVSWLDASQGICKIVPYVDIYFDESFSEPPNITASLSLPFPATTCSENVLDWFGYSVSDITKDGFRLHGGSSPGGSGCGIAGDSVAISRFGWLATGKKK